MLARIVSDTQSARDGLADVSREARDVLQTGGEDSASRADVMSYERALVRAQMAYRNFQGALGEVTTRSDMDMDIAPVDRELKSFADTLVEPKRPEPSCRGLAGREQCAWGLSRMSSGRHAAD